MVLRQSSSLQTPDKPSCSCPPEAAALRSGISPGVVSNRSAKWSDKLLMGPLPVTMACTKKLNMKNTATCPFFSSAKASGRLSAKGRSTHLPKRPINESVALHGSLHEDDLASPDG
ncbi:hypothetical protein L7F22_015087 [Adiantum nelumboides]|nr:hypothetical protein [Adiantum nelumboides]